MNEDEGELIDRIYEAGLMPGLWPDVIDRLSARLAARGGSLFVLSEGHLSWDAPPATRTIMEEYIAGGWDKRNPRLSGLLQQAHPGFIQDSDVAEGDYDQLPIVREFLRPRDIAFTAATVVKGARDDLAVFSIDRGAAGGPYTGVEIDWLDRLRPHLARSVALTSRLRMQQMTALTDTLQMLGVPAAMVTPGRGVTATNPSFDALAGSVFLASAFGRVSLRDRRADMALRQALAADGRLEPAIRSIPVRDAAGAVGVLHVIPACRQARDLTGGGMLLVLARPKENEAVEAEWLRWLYDLSPAEARVASRLTAGASIAQIASENGNALETVRTHVRQVLHKTGFRRQIDFVRSAGSLAVLKPALPTPRADAGNA